jgi:L-malate glycosyltransferase
MPVYNAALYLREAIDSMLNQTYRDFELIIINDGSTDASLNIIQSYKDPRIRLLNNERNLGIIATRNKGLQAATGEYIANMDADDISLPGRLEKQVNYLDAHPEITVLASRLVLINGQNQETGIWPEDYHCVSPQDIADTLPIINCVGQPTVMMRAEAIKKIGYNPKFVANEDWGLWLQVLSQGLGIAKLPEILLRYRQHTASETATINRSGVEKKILKFKFNYLRYQQQSDSFGNSDKKVQASFRRELFIFPLRTVFPRLFSFAGRLKKLNRKRFLSQLKNARTILNELKQPVPVLYFFPFFHTGGAERVHASIMEAAGLNNGLVFITSRSVNRAFYDKFSGAAQVIEIDELIQFGMTERWLKRRIGKLCSTGVTKVFGCNSSFFYTLIPTLPAHTEVIDLLHAFVHTYEDGPEKWSLPYVERINQRVVINQKTKNDLAQLYKERNLSAGLLQRITVIPNFTETQMQLPSKDAALLHVAYVGRAGEEKRIELIAQAAHNLQRSHPAIKFHFVGNIEPFVSEHLKPACIFHGEISDDAALQDLYAQFHVVLITSTREGFPVTIMEGMMQGAVPVSTNVGGIAEHVKNGENGFLIDAVSGEGIILEMEKRLAYLHENRKELQRLSEQAHQYALKTFNKDLFFKAYKELLTKKN